MDCSATGPRWQTTSGSFKVSVVDITAPTLHLPAGITTQATSAGKALVTYSSSAEDLVDGSVAVACTPASGSSFPVGTTAVVSTASDKAGNLASEEFKVTVNYAWKGFFQPIDNATLNVAKAGSTIPVKFSLGGNQGLQRLLH